MNWRYSPSCFLQYATLFSCFPFFSASSFVLLFPPFFFVFGFCFLSYRVSPSIFFFLVGVLFTTYANLVSITGKNKTVGQGQRRLDQILSWLGGRSFDGCLILDECHKVSRFSLFFSFFSFLLFSSLLFFFRHLFSCFPFCLALFPLCLFLFHFLSMCFSLLCVSACVLFLSLPFSPTSLFHFSFFFFTV